MADIPDFNAKLWSQNLSAVLDRNRDMAACRRLKQDIEQTLKKVADGILLFNEFNKKMEESQNVKDRDKAMLEMKRELKKLQRIREQIRSWANDTTIRDTSLLIEARRAIEHQMEHFKECEKEAKLKPFAKAALAAKNERIDPIVQAKEEAQRWLRESVSNLAEQVEGFEADVEITPEKAQELEPLIENHKTHITRLEQVMRLLENDQVEPNDLGNLKDSMEHYLQDAAEPDFVEDTLMYETLPLGDVDSRVGQFAKHDKDKASAKPLDGAEQEDSEDEEPASPGSAEKANAKRSRVGDAKAGKRKKDSAVAAPKKRQPKSKALPFAQGIVVTANTARQAVPSSAAPQTPVKQPWTAQEHAREAPVQRRAVALPKPLASDQLQPEQTSPHAGSARLNGHQEMGWQAESSTPRDQVHEQQQLSDMDTTFMEQLQGYDSFSLPPGLYPPAAAAGSPLGMQTPDQGTQISAGQLQTQGSHLSGGESYPLYYSAADQASSVQRPQCLSADAHYFQTAQMKLRAREERLQVERALQLTLMQQQQQAQAVQMQLQLQQQQQQQQLWQQPAPPPRVTVCEPQALYSPFASPVAQRQAAREDLDSGSDVEDTMAFLPDMSPHALPTVDEEFSQELPAEPNEDPRRQEGQGHERRDSRRRRGGRGKRGHDDSSLSPKEAPHRKPPSPKLADLIMPALKARAKAQGQGLEPQSLQPPAQEPQYAAAKGDNRAVCPLDVDPKVASATGDEPAADLRSFADVAKPAQSTQPAQLLRPWAQVAQGPPGPGPEQEQGSQPVASLSQARPASQGHQSLFLQQPSSSPAICHDDIHFPPLMPSFSPWLEPVSIQQPATSTAAPGYVTSANDSNALLAQQIQQQQQRLQLQAHMQQSAQAGLPLQWGFAHQKISSADTCLQIPPIHQAVKDHGSQQAAQIPEMPEAAVTVGPWSIKADWQPFSHKWQSDLRATLPPLGKGPVNPERAGERVRVPAINLWGEREECKPPSVPEPRKASPWVQSAVESSLKFRPGVGDQTYSTSHLAQAQGKLCSIRHLAEPIHADVSGRAAAERYPVKPGAIPQLFDKPEFFNKIAERSQIAGSSPDLLFFAFYFQPGTAQQRYAAAALQKLDWYYTPQTKRWYKAVNTPAADCSGRAGHGTLSMDQAACMYFHQDLKRTSLSDWEGWTVKHTSNSFGQGRAHHPSYP